VAALRLLLGVARRAMPADDIRRRLAARVGELEGYVARGVASPQVEEAVAVTSGQLRQLVAEYRLGRVWERGRDL
jgi:hypothetical protein